MSEAVAQAFAAAADYDRHARVQRLVARDLAQRIAALPLPPAPRILEVGCGTGFLTEALRAQGLGGDWLVTDVAPAMVARAQERMARHPSPVASRNTAEPQLSFAVLDGERGTPPGGPFDLVCSSLATQWFDDEPAALHRWRDWLAPQGHVMVATLAPGTFAEWREAHAAEHAAPGTLDFTPLARWQALRDIEPPIVEVRREAHADARAFLHALRAIGAATAAAGHRPLSAGALRRVMRRFEAAGAIATYEVVTCHLTHATDTP